MKRVFALALAICMALSMMVLTASAAPVPLCTHNKIPSNCSRHVRHVYVREISGDTVYYCQKESDGNPSDYSESKNNFKNMHDNFSPIVGLLLGRDDQGDWEVCNYGTPAQPKTGVMDTLPIWFGVMAVSACAYVLTSKKKVF